MERFGVILMEKVLEGILTFLLVTIAIVIIATVFYGLSGLIFWGIGSFIVWAFGIAFTFTFWHGLAIAFIISILTGIFGGKNGK